VEEVREVLELVRKLLERHGRGDATRRAERALKGLRRSGAGGP